jgi:hypothetical protein
VNEDRSQWIRCRPWIEAALPYCRGTHTIEDIEDGIASGQFVFWAGQKSAIITEILNYPRKRVLHYFLIGGDLHELVEFMEPRITQWAKEHGCTAVSGAGRKGFERVFARSGYVPAWRVIIKEI